MHRFFPARSLRFLSCLCASTALLSGCLPSESDPSAKPAVVPPPIYNVLAVLRGRQMTPTSWTYDVVRVLPSMQEINIGSFQAEGRIPPSFAKDHVYFVTASGTVATFDVHTRAIRQLDIPKIKPWSKNEEKTVTLTAETIHDMQPLPDGTLYLLQGMCNRGLPCKILTYDPITQTTVDFLDINKAVQMKTVTEVSFTHEPSKPDVGLKIAVGKSLSKKNPQIQYTLFDIDRQRKVLRSQYSKIRTSCNVVAACSPEEQANNTQLSTVLGRLTPVSCVPLLVERAGRQGTFGVFTSGAHTEIPGMFIGCLLQ